MKGILNFFDTITSYVNNIIDTISGTIDYISNGCNMLFSCLSGLPSELKAVFITLLALLLIVIVLNVLRDIF